MSIEQLDVVLLIASGVLLAAVAAVRLSASTSLPSLLLYLGLGLLIGEGGLGLRFDDAELTGALGYAALILILAEGGLTTRWDTVRPAMFPAVLLATVGTTVSLVVTGAAAHWILDVEWPFALLIGAVLASTDAAAVFSVLRRVPLPTRLTGMLEAESGLNDPPAVIAVVALTAHVLGGEGAHHPVLLLADAVLELFLGAVVGLALGRLGAAVLRRIALPASGLYPITVLGLALGTYAVASAAHGSGFLATYLACLVLGNARLPHGTAVRSFAEGVGWIAQIGLFVLLGLLASPSRLPQYLFPAIGIGLVLVLLARPLSVIVSTWSFRLPWRDSVFLCWAGLRGAVPIILATVPMAAGVPGGREIFDLVFVLVTVLTLVQAPILPWLARRLNLISAFAAVDLEVEVSPLGTLRADVLQVRIGPTSRLHGLEIFELRLPPGANVTLVVRGGRAFVPGSHTVLHHDDDLIVIVPAAERLRTEQRLRQLSLGGKLAAWRSPARVSRGLRRMPGSSGSVMAQVPRTVVVAPMPERRTGWWAYPWHSKRSSAKEHPGAGT